MSYEMPKSGLLLTAMIAMAGCSTTASIKVEQQFPSLVSTPIDIRATLIFDENFRTYLAKPNEKTSIDIGAAQVDLLNKAFRGLFSQVETVSSKAEVTADAGLVITPTVRQVQVSSPSDSYLNVYEVWIKYNLEIETTDGVPIDNWFLPAYGKTPDSFLVSRAEAIEGATVIALRDIGAKLLLDFFRIPAINAWIQEQNRLRPDNA